VDRNSAIYAQLWNATNRRHSHSRDNQQNPVSHRSEQRPFVVLTAIQHDYFLGRGSRGMKTGIVRFRKSSNIGTVKAVSPCAGAKTMPFAMTFARVGATCSTGRPSTAATSPDR